MRIHLKHLVFILFIGLAFSSCKKKTTTPTDSCSEITDTRDGQKYKVVKIGDQCWMAENLNYETATNSFCYGDDPANCDEHGRLYVFDVAQTACPDGWHVPTKAEVETLIAELGGDKVAGGKLKEGGSSGFNLKMSGVKDNVQGYALKGVGVAFWTSTSSGSIGRYAAGVIKSKNEITVSSDHKDSANTCRCIKD
jgi:uncharacterized protein (TIGR02145 family)